MTPASSNSPFVPLSRVFLFWSAALAILLLTGFLRAFLPPALGPLAWGLVASTAVLMVIRAFLKAEQRPLTDVGLGWTSRSPLRLAAGLGLGVATYAATLLLTAVVLGPIRLAPGDPPPPTAILAALLGLTAVSVMEELAFRSYALWTTLRTLGFWPAQLLVAVAFSLLHLAYGWPPSTVLLGVFPSALLFGTAAVVSGGLALPCGLHLGINLARWATGEGGGSGLWTLDISAFDTAHPAIVAPYLGAAVPVLIALGLYGLHRWSRAGRLTTA